MSRGGLKTCKNIIWRLRELNKEPFFRSDVIRCIMLEGGLDRKTIAKYWKVLRTLKYIKILHGKVCVFGENASDAV